MPIKRSALPAPSSVREFQSLFTGNGVGHGKHMFKKGERVSWSDTGAASSEDFEKHLMGMTGLGIVPIREDNRCVFGVIDYDAHHGENGTEVALRSIEQTVRKQRLPLVVCRSTHGGAHLIVLFREPVQAASCKQLLKLWAKQLGLYEEAEVFPKQAYLSAGQMGNTINIPYFDCEHSNRYAILDGKELTFQAFIEHCVASRVLKSDMNAYMSAEHAEAPPCIQRMISEGVVSGSRNEAIYNITIYMRRKDHGTFKDKVIDINSSSLARPLPIKELRRTIASASNKDYRYRCNESPCRDLCNRELCLMRQYGIRSEEDIDEDIYGSLVKHNTEPVQWVLHVQGKPVTVCTRVLMDHKRLTEAVADITTVVIPALNAPEWRRKLAELMANASEEAAPTDATEGGALMNKLAEFVRKAHVPELDTEEAIMAAREALHRGQPVAELNDDNECVVHFRGKDFMDYLKRTRQGDVRGATVWMALRRNGIGAGKVRAGRAIVSVWSIACDITEDKQITPDFFGAADF